MRTVNTQAPPKPVPPRIQTVKEGGGSCCVWLLIAVACFVALLCSGCATSRCSVAVYGEVDEVTVEARYEVGVPSGRTK